MKALVLVALLAASVATATETVQAELAVVKTASPQDLELRLTLTIAAGWHIYGRTGGGDGGQLPLELKLQLPPGIEAVGAWQWPNARKKGGLETYESRQVFRHRIRQMKSGKLSIRVNAAYQACSAQVCLAPEEVEVSVATGP